MDPIVSYTVSSNARTLPFCVRQPTLAPKLCYPYNMNHTTDRMTALWNTSNFQVTMNKEEGVRTVVVGGKKDVQQQYSGTV